MNQVPKVINVPRVLRRGICLPAFLILSLVFRVSTSVACITVDEEGFYEGDKDLYSVIFREANLSGFRFGIEVQALEPALAKLEPKLESEKNLIRWEIRDTMEYIDYLERLLDLGNHLVFTGIRDNGNGSLTLSARLGVPSPLQRAWRIKGLEAIALTKSISKKETQDKENRFKGVPYSSGDLIFDSTSENMTVSIRGGSNPQIVMGDFTQSHGLETQTEGSFQLEGPYNTWKVTARWGRFQFELEVFNLDDKLFLRVTDPTDRTAITLKHRENEAD